MKRQRQRPLILSLGCLLGLVALLAGAATAQAHAHYAHSEPSISQVLQAAPARVDIYTDSDMRKLAGANVITVTGSDGSRVDDGNTIVDDANRQHFSVGLQPNLPNGRYVVSFQTLSDVDGDTDHGKFAFYVGAGPTAAQQQLDAQLNGPIPSNLLPSASSAPSGSSGPQIPLAVPLTGAVALALVLATGAGVVLRRRHANPRESS
jgi:methionine-rich copper-binding protein CopC